MFITTVIDYAYDPLYRLIAADYDSGQFFHYGYDAVGNRLLQETHNATNVYAYDAANRLVEVDGVAYTWDANGNLLDDGERTYTYDHANRLTALSDQGTLYVYAYNGLGDRLQQSVNGVPTDYVLDLNAGLTQVLEAGTNAYLYGLDRIGEVQGSAWQYLLTDALGSSRQLADASATVNRTRSYEPFGSVLLTAGNGASSYGFAGEWTDPSDFIYLRARYYASTWGRFFVSDYYQGVYTFPLTQNRYQYGLANPILYSDPSGCCVNNTTILNPANWYKAVGECANNLQKFKDTLDNNPNVSDIVSSSFWNLNPTGIQARDFLIGMSEAFEASNAVFYGREGYANAFEYRKCDPLGYFKDVLHTYVGLIMPAQLITVSGWSAVRTPIIKHLGGNPAGMFGTNIPDISKIKFWTGFPGGKLRMGKGYPLNINIELTTGESINLMRGGEFRFGENMRIAPFGQTSTKWQERFPHYHLRGLRNSVNNEPRAGQGIGRHRPWQTSPDDIYITDRFFDIELLLDLLKRIFGR